MTRVEPSRLAVPAVLVLAVAIVAVLVAGGGDGYTVKARFSDAGQLVKGGLVQIGGRAVGTIDALDLTEDGQAELTLRITDDDATPLKRGTVARIRAVGQSGVTNRFIDLRPGEGADIDDGGTLSVQETRTIVDLDQVLNGLGPDTRRQLQRIIRNGAKIYEGDTAEQANDALRYLDPAVSQLGALADEITHDAQAFESLITSSARTVSALASRRTDLESGITSTARTLEAIARENDELGAILERGPDGLRRATRTFRSLRLALEALRPALVELRPVTPPLRTVLRRLIPTSRALRPVVADLRDISPSLRRAIAGLPPLARVAVPALRSTTSTLVAAAPIVKGLRPYAPDVVSGLFGGLGNSASAPYDANGHYARIAPLFLGAGAPGLLGGSNAGVRTGRDARCPGGAVEPHADGSNPYVEDPSTCKAGG